MYLFSDNCWGSCYFNACRDKHDCYMLKLLTFLSFLRKAELIILMPPHVRRSTHQ